MAGSQVQTITNASPAEAGNSMLAKTAFASHMFPAANSPIVNQSILLPGFLALLLSGTLMAETRVLVSGRETGRVSPLLFGQMLERCEPKNPNGEQGAERMTDGTGKVRADVRPLLEEMQIPVVRFPGGSIVDDAEPLHWTKLIGPLPPSGTRQSNRGMGYDEFFALASELKWKTIVAINFRAILEANRDDASLRQAIAGSCGVAAYATSPKGAKLPQGMEDWPARRIANGHVEPWKIDYLQIGNEWIVYLGTLLQKPGADFDADVKWVGKCIRETSKTLRAICPGVPVITDGVLWDGPTLDVCHNALDHLYADPEVRAALDLITVHVYRPWSTKLVERDGKPVEFSALEPGEIWLAMQSVPQIDDQGMSVLSGPNESMPGFALAAKHRLPMAVTEWNWNGGGENQPTISSFYGRGVAAAGFLHAFIRHGAVVLGCQSMLAGNGWGINSIRIPSEGSPYIQPTARVVGFYQQHHGDRVLATEIQDSPLVEQPIRIGQISPVKQIALVDAVATADEKQIFVHLINRSYDRALPVVIGGENGIALSGSAELHRLCGEVENYPAPGSPGRDRVKITREMTGCRDGEWRGELPARTITILQFRRK